jgi:hypothetical protein
MIDDGPLLDDKQRAGIFSWSPLAKRVRADHPQTIVLIVGEITPVEWYALHDKQPYPGQKYRAWIEDGTYVLEASWQPFCDAARELLATGFDPKSALVMKRLGSDFISLSGILGEVAKLSVHEGKQGTRFAPYVPFDRERAFPSRGDGKEPFKSPEAT